MTGAAGIRSVTEHCVIVPRKGYAPERPDLPMSGRLLRNNECMPQLTELRQGRTPHAGHTRVCVGLAPSRPQQSE